jgi:hypothetical protein
LGSGILIFILLAIAFVFCIIPSIYLGTVFYLIVPIIVIENASFGFAFNKSFRLISDNWWLTFGVIFIIHLIIWVLSVSINLPLTVITSGTEFFTIKNFPLPAILFVSIVRAMLELVYILPAIAISLCYFNLVEEKDSTGLLMRIENLGKSDDETPTFPAEEY